MCKFNKKCLYQNQIQEDDKGIKLEELLALIIDNEYYEDIVTLLDINKTKDKFINIIGASTLVGIMNGIKKRYHKIDLISYLKDIEIYDDDNFSINLK